MTSQELDGVLAHELASWPVGSAAVAVLTPHGTVGRAGDTSCPHPWASVTKLLTALTVLRTVDEGLIGLDEQVGPPGATIRHLLAHVSGIAIDSERRIAEPGRRRVYSNRGFEIVATHVEERTGGSFHDLVRDTVLAPLGMDRTTATGSPAHGATGPVDDLARLAHELLMPRALSPGTVALATTTAFPGLAGLLPGFGRQTPNDWGLGFEIRGTKSPHWTAPSGAPTTFGHFGQSGAFLWVDPEERLACVSASDTPFGPWAAEAWPRMAEQVLEVYRAKSPAAPGDGTP